MSLDNLKSRKRELNNKCNNIFDNMNAITNESLRVSKIASNSQKILDDLDKEFELKTGLQGNDIKFLFAAVAMQIVRIFIVNKLTNIEKAGSSNTNEERLTKIQEKLLGCFNPDDIITEKPYYASMNHIITKKGVPYDATAYLSDKSILTLLKKNRNWDFDIEKFIPNEKFHLFKGANHRFSTLGHDPILGLIFGTANIMTNTISCVKASVMNIPIITTNHVVYTSDYKDPRIATYASTGIMLQKAFERVKNQPSAFVASLIKQIIHIGTDLYTPFGIQIPSANLILSNSEVEKMTRYINSGDIIKVSTSAWIAELINIIISTLHMLMYDTSMKVSKNLYNVRTRKIIFYSNIIATGSNVLWVCGNMLAGNSSTIRQLDIGGLLVIIKRLMYDKEYIRNIKEEFVFNRFNKLIQCN